MAEQRRESDSRIDNIENMVTKIHTVLIGNGVPGLVSRHDDLNKKVEQCDNSVKKIVYGGGGIIIVVTIITNIERIISFFR